MCSTIGIGIEPNSLLKCLFFLVHFSIFYVLNRDGEFTRKKNVSKYTGKVVKMIK